jgi:ribonuclease P protein component
MHLQHLSGRKACDRVQRHGIPWRGTYFTARYLLDHPRNLAAAPSVPTLYLGTFASAALHKSAVRRNRMRRRCREALGAAIKAQPDICTAQLLVSPRSASLDAPFPLIQSEADAFLAVLSHACRKQQKSPPPASSNLR